MLMPKRVKRRRVFRGRMKGKATRVAHRVTEVEREDGSKKKKIVRVCKRCKADID